MPARGRPVCLGLAAFEGVEGRTRIQKWAHSAQSALNTRTRWASPAHARPLKLPSPRGFTRLDGAMLLASKLPCLSTMQQTLRSALLVAALVVGALVGATSRSQARAPGPEVPTPGADACFTCGTYEGMDGRVHKGCIVVLQSKGCTHLRTGGCQNGTSSCQVRPY